MHEQYRAPHEQEVIQAVRDNQNEIEEGLREFFLRNNLFHDHVFATGDIVRLAALQHEFFQDKEGKNLGERFDLALSPKYFNKIHVVELGHATAPFVNSEYEHLVNEYRDLRRWLIENGLITSEASRDNSQRTLEVRFPKDTQHPHLFRERMAIIRNRPLIDGQFVRNDPEQTVVQFGIAKRMVFSIPTAKFYGELVGDGRNSKVKSPEGVRTVESWLDARDPDIDHIRISYYLTSRRVGQLNENLPEPDF